MVRVADVLAVLESIAPSWCAVPGDRIGLQVGSPDRPVRRALVALDADPATVRRAREEGADLLITHHPVIWDPLSTLRSDSAVGSSLELLIAHGISAIAAHTNWDYARGGVNDVLADLLGLREARPFGEGPRPERLKLVTFAPPEHVERLLDALSEAGAGRIGAYERCAFLADGIGTYRGDETTRPFIGEPGRIERTPEVRVEMVLPRSRSVAVVAALRAVHPYEEPAFDLYPVLAEPHPGMGRIGLVEPCPLADLAARVGEVLETVVASYGDPERIVSRVAVIGGGAGSEWQAAAAAGADVFLTGEVRHHEVLAATDRGLAVLAAGHEATEAPSMPALRARLSEALPEIEWLTHRPLPGLSGRAYRGRES